MKLIDLVKGNRVRFSFYRKGELWYEVVGKEFVFPVPIDDCGDGTFLNEDKSEVFMRYIRKYLEKYNEEYKAWNKQRAWCSERRIEWRKIVAYKDLYYQTAKNVCADIYAELVRYEEE